MTEMTLAEGHVQGFALVRTHTERFCTLVASLTEDDLARRVPGLDWTAGEVVTHVHSVYERYTVDLRRAATPAEVARHNAEDIERLGIDPVASVASMREQVTSMEAIIPHVEPAQRFPFHAGLQTTLAGGWGNLLGELLAHGDDIARATGRSFGVPGPDLEVLWRFTTPLLDGWVRPECRDLDESWDLELPFGRRRAVLTAGHLRWGDDLAVRPDHHRIEARDQDLADLTLAVPYRRRPVTDPELALFASRFVDL